MDIIGKTAYLLKDSDAMLVFKIMWSMKADITTSSIFP